MQDQHGDFIDAIAAQDIMQADAIAHAHTMQFHGRFLKALQHTPDADFDLGLSLGSTKGGGNSCDMTLASCSLTISMLHFSRILLSVM